MTKRRRQPLPTMAELVAELPPSAGPAVPWVQPVRDGSWTDEQGTTWQARRSFSIARLDRLMRSPETRVLLCYGPDAPEDVPVSQRQQLWTRALPYLEGRAGPADDHTDYVAAEFRGPDDRALVVFERSC